MRRAPIVITATVLGTAGVLLFRPLPTSAVVATGTGTGTGTDSNTSSSSSGGTTSSSSGGGTSSSDDSSSSSAAASSDSSASRSSDATGTSSAKDGTYTGDAETVRWGTTQVKVTISDGKITDVTVVQENQNESRSVQISENAFPVLRSEVLSKQTAAVDTVSGATYTSDQYEASLQSALDKAGFTAADKSKANTDLATADANLQGH